MILYLIVITVCGACIALLNAWGFGERMSVTFSITFGGILVEIILDGITAAICRGLPKKCVPYGANFFAVGKKEKAFYEKLHIRKWKDRIPEIGHFTGFRKTKVEDPKSIEYVERFLLECRYGEVGHLVSCFSGFFVCLLCLFPAVRWTVTVPIAVVNAWLNILPFAVLRYNTYKLEVLYKTNKKRLQRGTTFL